MKKFVLLLSITSNLFHVYSQTNEISEECKQTTLYENDKEEYVKDEPKESPIYECKDVISIKTGKVTENVIAESKKILFITNDGGKTGFNISVSKQQETIILSIAASGIENRINKEDKMDVVFNDGTKIKLINTSKFKYFPKFVIYLGNNQGNKDKLETFKSKEIKTLRVRSLQGNFEKNLTSLQSKLLMKTFECIDDI